VNPNVPGTIEYAIWAYAREIEAAERERISKLIRAVLDSSA